MPGPACHLDSHRVRRGAAPVVLHAYDAAAVERTRRSRSRSKAEIGRPYWALPGLIKGAEGQAIELPVPVADPDDDTLAAWADHCHPEPADPARRYLSLDARLRVGGHLRGRDVPLQRRGERGQQPGHFRHRTGRPWAGTAPTRDRTIREGDRLRFYLQGSDPTATRSRFTATCCHPARCWIPTPGCSIGRPTSTWKASTKCPSRSPVATIDQARPRPRSR